MESVAQKLKRNLREGTFFKNVPIAIRNRLIKRIQVSNALYFLNKGSVMTKKYQRGIQKLGTNGIKFGNYYLDKRVPLTSESIVYSLGILEDISFDRSVQEKFGCAIFMYDPTPVSVAFMEKHRDNPLLKFHPVGVWTEDTVLRFYTPKLGGSSSVMASEEDSSGYFDANCLRMQTIMRQNQHDHISVFKADIEGAALPVLLQMVEQRIFPDQIVVELERPKDTKDLPKIEAFFADVSRLRTTLTQHGYEEFLLPRKVGTYFSLEMLFVKKDKMKIA